MGYFDEEMFSYMNYEIRGVLSYFNVIRVLSQRPRGACNL